MPAVRKAAKPRARSGERPALRLSAELIDQVTARLHRVEGQVRAIARMIEERRDCHEIAQQMAAANAALTRATVQLMTASMVQCIREGGPDESTEMTRLSESFIKLLT